MGTVSGSSVANVVGTGSLTIPMMKKLGYHKDFAGAVEAAKLREVLSTSELADLDDGGEVDTEAILAATVSAKASANNISYPAFTATPKAKTLELFGRPGPDGVPVAFHRYSMRQAIEEGYILDVLLNYTPYKVASSRSPTTGRRHLQLQ